jgi:hypothetical protein
VRRIVFALLLCLASVCAAEETWFSVHLDGRQIGHMRSLRALDTDGRVRHEQSLVLSVERNGDALRISSDERSWETVDGTPLAFEVEVDTAGSVIRSRGQVRDGEVRVQVEQQGQESELRLAWPEGALLPEGQRLESERAGFVDGTEYRLTGFDPSSLQPYAIHTRVGALQAVDIHGQEEMLIPLHQTLALGGGSTDTHAWIEPIGHNLRRLRLPAVGLMLEMQACDRACAMAPVQPTDVLKSILVPAPVALAPRQLRRPLQYRLRLSAGGSDSLDRAPGQFLRALDDEREFSLLVDPRGEDVHPPQAEDLGSNRWLQSDAPEVVALAREAVGDLENPAAMVERLTAFVRGYIHTKSLRVGYASAREIISAREGDCTEHAVLLAALTRASGIPARVVTGIAYAPRFGEYRNVFVPHAWVVAWIDGRWRGFDAALPSFDAGHIAFSVGDGTTFKAGIVCAVILCPLIHR